MRIKNTVFVLVFLAGYCFWGGSQGVAGATYDIKEMTPPVKAALDGRRDRFERLRDLKSQGVIGEDMKGYVKVLADNAEAQELANSENNDRRLIYKTIVEQNNLATEALSTVEEVFAQVQRDKASPGDQIQDASGNWTTK